MAVTVEAAMDLVEPMGAMVVTVAAAMGLVAAAMAAVAMDSLLLNRLCWSWEP